MNKSKLLGVMAEKGITQKELASRMGVSANTVSDKINGRRYFDTKEAVLICEILEITDDTLKADIFLRQPS